MDVFLQPLVEELKELWEEGVVMRDGASGSMFKMRAAVLWTINDYPARSSLSGWSGQGYFGCSTCNKGTPALKCRSKIVYYDHRRFLPAGHPMRKSIHYVKRNEKTLPPHKLSASDLLEQLRHVPQATPGKHVNFGGKKRKRGPLELNWSKKSIFYRLPYWSQLRLQHNLDVMHIEKNVCGNVLGTLLNNEKSKDTDKARLDLMDLDIKKDLHLELQGDKWYKPPAKYILTEEERKRFTDFLMSIKFPDGFAGNLKKNVSSDGKLTGLKSHDSHVIMQRLLAPGIRGFMPKPIRETIAELCRFFKIISARTLHTDDLEKAKDEIILIVCKLERIFPPAFFTIMVHLVIHLPEEALNGGPVHMRWMYPFERYLGTLKHFVKNKAKPEGSIAEAYVIDEALTFCSRYLESVDSRFNMQRRTDVASNFEVKERELSVFKSHNCKPFGAMKPMRLDEKTRTLAEWYILNNCTEVDPYLR